MLGSEEREPQPGENLVLTIDENIQFMAERRWTQHGADHALNGTVVIQDPHTGQILALAVRPTFNPNDFRHATTGLLRNHAVSDVYEPGSTFKPVTYAAALEEKAITPDTMVDCGGGQHQRRRPHRARCSRRSFWNAPCLEGPCGFQQRLCDPRGRNA